MRGEVWAKKLTCAVEEQIGVAESAKKAFREEILIRISTLAPGAG